MRFDAVIELVSPGGYVQDAIGQQVESDPTRRTVYANEFSVSAREFYDAGAQGLKPERMYQLRSIDYQGEDSAIVDGVEYNIIRPQRRGEWTLLAMERVAGDG